jgi:hypothetical protein
MCSSGVTCLRPDSCFNELALYNNPNSQCAGLVQSGLHHHHHHHHFIEYNLVSSWYSCNIAQQQSLAYSYAMKCVPILDLVQSLWSYSGERFYLHNCSTTITCSLVCYEMCSYFRPRSIVMVIFRWTVYLQHCSTTIACSLVCCEMCSYFRPRSIVMVIFRWTFLFATLLNNNRLLTRMLWNVFLF